MTQTPDMDVTVLDYSAERGVFRRDVIDGLSRPSKSLPCKYLYDKRGSELFDRICELDAYYPTRTEISIMEAFGAEMADAIGPGALIIEYGSGSSLKTPLLLMCLEAPAGYIPVDISGEHLEEAAHRINDRFPALKVMPVCADFTHPFDLPPEADDAAQRVVYFPGSTIGNLTRGAARDMLRAMYVETNGGKVLIGVDLEKDPRILERAYDDEEGVTAEFNYNLLRRLNRELDADFDLDAFGYDATWNPDAARVEMHLVSRRRQDVSIGDDTVSFERDELIHTENSHKYSPARFAALAESAGWRVERVWTDPRRLFSVQLLVAADRA